MTEEQEVKAWNDEREFLEGEVQHFVNTLFEHTGADEITLPTEWRGVKYTLQLKATKI